MAGANGARLMPWGALGRPSTVTTNLADVRSPSSMGIITFNCVSLAKRTFAVMPSKVTLTFAPVNFVPKIVAIDPGATNPGAKLAPFTMVVTAGDGTGGGAAVTVSVMATTREPAIGPASTVSVAL